MQVRLLTTDANLARNAEVQGVPTVNLRRLAADLAPEIVAGQPLRVALVKSGQQPGQGVGYLDDGSMVVVNEGAALVGAGERDFVATSVVPTAAGRIVFARTHGADAEAQGRRAFADAETTDPPRRASIDRVTVWAIVVAAGGGTRFGGAKQFEHLGSARVVDHAVATAARSCDGVVVVVPAGPEWDGAPVNDSVPGGATRSASVRAGLDAVPESVDIVVVHDAARPARELRPLRRRRRRRAQGRRRRGSGFGDRRHPQATRRRPDRRHGPA